MNSTRPTLFALALVTALAGPAWADAGEAASESDENISQIDGQLVPVGKHNEYRYDYPRVNVATNPLGWIMGIYGVSVSYAVSDQIALRGDINVTSADADVAFDHELNAGLPIYFRRAYQGLFLEPGLMSRSFGVGDREFGPQVLAGWHWRWDSGLNAAIAFGMGRDLSGDESGSGTDIFGNGYLRFGYAF